MWEVRSAGDRGGWADFQAPRHWGVALDQTQLCGRQTPLEFLFPVTDVLPTKAAVLLLLELVRSLETLMRRVVAVAALGALEKDVSFLDLHGGALSTVGWRRAERWGQVEGRNVALPTIPLQ